MAWVIGAASGLWPAGNWRTGVLGVETGLGRGEGGVGGGGGEGGEMRFLLVTALGVTRNRQSAELQRRLRDLLQSESAKRNLSFDYMKTMFISAYHLCVMHAVCAFEQALSAAVINAA